MRHNRVVDQLVGCVMVENVIDRMLEILGPNGEHWTKNREARDSRGMFVMPTDERAVCWCILGAARKATSETCDYISYEITNELTHRFHEYYKEERAVSFWQDHKDRTWEEVRDFLLWVKNESKK